MADRLAPLLETSSYASLLRAVDSASTPLAIRLLRTTHTGRVIEDGLSKGMQGLVSSIIGLPRDLYEFGAERFRGTKSATPEAERIMSSAWLDKKMETVHDSQLKILGRERPKIREGTTDGLVHIGAQFVPLVGSFFIPGIGQSQMVAAGAKYGKAAELTAKVAGNAGFQLNALDLTTLGIEGAEKLAGIERPTEVAKSTLPSSSPTVIKAGVDAQTAFSDASTGTGNTGSKQQQIVRPSGTTAKFEM